MKKLFLNSAIVLSSFFGVISCSEDSEPQVQEVDIEDANAISGAIEISKATRLEGAPPAPTTVAGTPGISSDIEAVTGSEGNRVVVPFSLDSGDVQGVYFQIAGADGYYQIPVSGLGGSNGRIGKSRRGSPFGRLKKINNYYGFSIELPENLKPGEFCAAYCVYDAENRVSNVVEVCIEVDEFGGANAGSLTANGWSMVYEKEVYYDHTYDDQWNVIDSALVTVVDSLGVTEIDTYDTEYPCGDGTTKTLEISNEYTTLKGDLYFSENGAFKYDGADKEIYFDYQNTTCENGPAYTNNQDEYSSVGVWSYNEETQELTLIVNDEEEGETYFEIYDLKIENDFLTLFIDLGNDESVEIGFKKK